MTATSFGHVTGEQARQHQRLGNRRVLILVEYDERESLTLDAADLGVLHGQSRRQRDLIGEVDQAERGFERPIVIDQVQEFGTPFDGTGELCEITLGPSGEGLDRLREDARIERPNGIGFDEVFAQLTVEGEDVADHGFGGGPRAG